MKLSRRKFMRYSLEAGLMVGCVGGASAMAREGAYVRPPGSVADLSRACIRCGACVEVCPERA